MERKKAKKKDKKGAVKEVDVKPTTPKIITGPPSMANISQTSNLRNHLNLEITPDPRKGVEPLFKKSAATTSYMTLDGPVHCDKSLVMPGGAKTSKNRLGADPLTAGSGDQPYTSISDNLRLRQMRENAKNKIQSQSRFIALQKAEKLSSHISQNRERLEVCVDGS